MRVTIDLDSKNIFKFMFTLIKGLALIRRPPDVIRKSPSGKGYHFIWRGLNITQEQAYAYRKFIGDDKNRIRLDQSSNKRVKQVLFTKKEVIYYK
jgi:hypothetical protein